MTHDVPAHTHDADPPPLPRFGSIWTEAVTERAVGLFKAGHSAASIVRVLSEDGISTTRCAVIGRLHRMGVRREQQARLPAMATNNSAPERISKLTAARAAPHPKPDKGFVPRIVEVAPLNLSMLDIEDGQCRYETSGQEDSSAFLFCGLPTVHEGSWCRQHRALVFVPREKRRPVKKPMWRAA